MKRLFSIALALIFLAGPASGSSAGTRPSGSPRSAQHSSPQTLHVKSYTRKDGTVVRAYSRSYSGRASRPQSRSTAENTPLPSGTTGNPETLTPAPGPRDSHGRLKRSPAAKAAFKRQDPCPATGRPAGPCPGYVIDHIKALACGGADTPGNMQWQTLAEGKAKDKWERIGCEQGR